RAINMLAHRLRQNPDWARFTADKIAPVVDERVQLVDGVELLLREIELNRVIVEMRTQPVVAQPKTAVEWTPSAHQELVLKVLKRDGRMRTGLLWERVVPKHVDKRAHQNQMRDLVRHDRVLTTGKAQATEYW